jgi:hypothetical protein
MSVRQKVFHLGKDGFAGLVHFTESVNTSVGDLNGSDPGFGPVAIIFEIACQRFEYGLFSGSGKANDGGSHDGKVPPKKRRWCATARRIGSIRHRVAARIKITH